MAKTHCTNLHFLELLTLGKIGEGEYLVMRELTVKINKEHLLNFHL